MANNLKVDEIVLVPAKLLPSPESYSHAVYRTKVIEIEGRSAKVQIRNAESSDWIASSKIQRGLGVLVLSVGDFATELSLIDPLSKSVLNFCRMLLPDDSVRSMNGKPSGIHSCDSRRAWQT